MVYMACIIVELQLVVVVKYNYFFVLLALIIPGKQSIIAEVFDVYLEPLVKELLQLWEGVEAYDITKDVGARAFKLRAMMLL